MIDTTFVPWKFVCVCGGGGCVGVCVCVVQEDGDSLAQLKKEVATVSVIYKDG